MPEWKKKKLGRIGILYRKNIIVIMNKLDILLYRLDPRAKSRPIPCKSPEQLRHEEERRHYNWVVREAIPDCNNKIQLAFSQVETYDAERSQAEIQLNAVKAMQGEIEYHKMCIATMAARQATLDRLKWAQTQKQKYMAKIKSLQNLKLELEIKLNIPEDEINRIRPGTSLLRKKLDFLRCPRWPHFLFPFTSSRNSS